MNVTTLLEKTVSADASDLHLSSGEPPHIRVCGEMQALDHPPLSQGEVRTMILEIMNDLQRLTFEEDWEVDFSLGIPELGRFRVNVFMQQHGEAAAFRVIPDKIKSLEELGLPPILGSLCAKEKGLILFTGPTGSGKTTSQAAMIDLINRTTQRHIITIEDPIEFVHCSEKCLINQRELGVHTRSLAGALRSALREDPDVILVGEMRDLRTIELALTAAETGHVVFGTLHASSTVTSIDRIIDAFPTGQQPQIRLQLADTLVAIIAQMLCRRSDSGRVAAVEILMATHAIRNLIRESKAHQIGAMMQAGGQEGMQTMAGALQRLVREGEITPEEARRKCLGFGLLSEVTSPRLAA